MKLVSILIIILINQIARNDSAPVDGSGLGSGQQENNNEPREQETNYRVCLGKTGYPCKTDADCDGLGPRSCLTRCHGLMKICYFISGYDTMAFKK